MSSAVFKVTKPGLLTTFQDKGRTGFQEYGVVVSGAMDDFSLQIGNLLVGNPAGEAGIEVTLMGPELKALEDVVIAICGGNLSPKVNGQPAPMWKSFKVKKAKLWSLENQFQVPVPIFAWQEAFRFQKPWEANQPFKGKPRWSRGKSVSTGRYFVRDLSKRQ